MSRRVRGSASGRQGTRELYRTIMERSPLAMFATEGPAHVLVYANAAFCGLCGRPPESLVGRPAADAIPGCAGAGGLLPLLDRAFATREAVGVADVVYVDPAGGPARWSCGVWPLSVAADRMVGLAGYAAAAGPTSPSGEEAHAQIRAVNEALIVSSMQQLEIADAATAALNALRESEEKARQSAVLEERNRIARDIHDTLAQAFTAILLELRIARRIAHERPLEAADLLAHASDLAQHGLAEARRSVWSLQPEALEYGDLVGALSRAVDRVAAEATAQMELHVDGTPMAVPPDIGVNLLRIAEEAIANALRHGQPRMIWIGLTFADGRVRLRVQDDGRGFEVARHADGGGFGMVSMGQRAERLGGQFSVVSQPGRGAEVAVSVPLPADEPGEGKP